MKFKNLCSTAFLLIIVGSYLGIYFETPLVVQSVFSFEEKISLLNSLLSSGVEGRDIGTYGIQRYRQILNDFSSINELIEFLKDDDTNTLTYSTPDFVCHHFSEKLIREANERGYYLQYLGLYGKELKKYQDYYDSYIKSLGYIVGRWGEGEGHAVCMAVIDERIIIIEPQTDVVLEKINGKYVGLYRGEVS